MSWRATRGEVGRVLLGALLVVTTATAVAMVPPGAAQATSPPVARADVAVARSGQSIAIGVLANDFDPDGGSVVVSSVDVPAHGAVVNGGSFFNYTPDAGFAGLETITYTIA